MANIQITIVLDEEAIWANGTVAQWADRMDLEGEPTARAVLEAIAIDASAGGNWTEFVTRQTIVTKTMGEMEEEAFAQIKE